jgi:ferredoxin-NADP reductase
MELKTAKVNDKKNLSHDVIELEFETKEIFNFQAGQFITVKIDDKKGSQCFRAYSISSSVKGKNCFDLCVKVVENGRGSVWLNNLAVGDEIKFLGPTGNFIFDEEVKNNIYFVATGTGIAPLKSMIEDLLINKNYKKNLNLILGVRYIKNIFYDEFFDDLTKKYNNFKYEITVSQPEEAGWNGNVGRVTQFIEKMKFDVNDSCFYICGLKAMVDEVSHMLAGKGVNEKDIHHEKYI